MKRCCCCKIEKPLFCFSNNKTTKDKLSKQCRLCAKKYRQRPESREKKKIRTKNRIKKPQEIEKTKESRRLYAQRDYVIEKRRKRDRERDRTKDRKTKRKYESNRMKTDPMYRLKKLLRSLISSSFKNRFTKKSKKSIEIIGCSFEELERHLIESSIKNYGHYSENQRLGQCEKHLRYEIDHIIPISSAKNEEELIQLNHYTNLQWLTREDNLKKSNKTP